jgi:hypothetical protein
VRGAAAVQPRTLQRITALLALLILTSAPLSATLHLALVPHSICWEHGELAHLTAPPEAVADGRLAPISLPRRSHAAPNGAAVTHDHCGLGLGVTPVSAALADRVHSVATESPAVELEGWPASTAARGIPILAFAPKQSPPVGLRRG